VEKILRARTALPDHNPVLVLHDELVLEPDCHHDSSPSDLIAWVQTADVDAELARLHGFPQQDPEMLGTGDERYYLDSYDVNHFGEPELLVILPRPEPWAALAYLDPYDGWGTPGTLVLAAARRWHDRFGAAPTTVGLAIGFTVPRPPTDLADAERLAKEHVAIAGLTPQTKTRAYARALLELNQWCLYERP
jgi:hypothetical protein